jgi:hypothetical protein
VPWANLDDQFPKHPKVIGLTDGAFRLHVSGICYAAQYRTDGLVDIETVPLLMRRYRKGLLDELIRKGHWHDAGEGCDTDTCQPGQPGNYVIHDYLQWNRSRDAIAAERDRIHKARSDAGKKGAQARWQK